MKTTRPDEQELAEDRSRPQSQRPRDGRPDPTTTADPRTLERPRATSTREAVTPHERDRPRPSDEAESQSMPAGSAEHAPGQVRSERTVELLPDRAVEGLRERWREVQLRFVDDPRAAAAEADTVVSDTINMLNESLQSARTDLSEWRTSNESDTEGLRVALRRYRGFLDRVLAL
jgi:hypothetical protein